MKWTCTLLSFFSIISLQAQPPANYYSSTSGQSCATLKTTLRNIINTGISRQTYTALWAQYQLTDIKPREVGTGSANVIWDVYSDNPVGPDPYNFTPGTGTGGQQDQGSGGSAEGQFYNREHSVPLSWFNGSTGTPSAATDYHHILPTDKRVNNVRANFPYGNVAVASFTSLNGGRLGTSALPGFGSTVFEPIDSFKGDLARAFLYFTTMYQDSMVNWASDADAVQSFEPNTYPSVDLPFLQLMIQWHNFDRVSTKEIVRNNGGFSFQGNRNPYVDSPQFVSRVWNNGCPGLSSLVLPVDLQQFTARLDGNNVLLNWAVGTEVNVAEYVIERGTTPMNMKPIASLKANGSAAYSHTDPLGNNTERALLYRIKMVDKDGSLRYSGLQVVLLTPGLKFNVQPNPANDYVWVTLPNSPTQATLTVVDFSGRVLLRRVVSGSQAQLRVAELPAGSYRLLMQAGKGTQSLPLLIQRN